MTKIAIGMGLLFLIPCTVCVTIAALFPPKEYKGDGKTDRQAAWDESIEDVWREDSCC